MGVVGGFAADPALENGFGDAAAAELAPKVEGATGGLAPDPTVPKCECGTDGGGIIVFGVCFTAGAVGFVVAWDAVVETLGGGGKLIDNTGAARAFVVEPVGVLGWRWWRWFEEDDDDGGKRGGVLAVDDGEGGGRDGDIGLALFGFGRTGGGTGIGNGTSTSIGLAEPIVRVC